MTKYSSGQTQLCVFCCYSIIYLGNSAVKRIVGVRSMAKVYVRISERTGVRASSVHLTLSEIKSIVHGRNNFGCRAEKLSGILDEYIHLDGETILEGFAAVMKGKQK